MDRQSENPLQALPPVDLSASASDTSLPLVSVVSPTTYERRWTHESLYRQFANQSYPNKELCVLDTGPAPSPFFSTLDPPDDRVTYVHIQCDMSGMSMDQVNNQFGAPGEKYAAVGEPPITRWVYDHYTVYFEHDHVIHSVLHRN